MSDVINAATDRIIAAIQARDEYIDLLLKKELRAAMWFARDTALEKAAKVAEERVAYSTGQAVIRDSIAAAIRAMIPNGNVPAQDDTGSAE